MLYLLRIASPVMEDPGEAAGDDSIAARLEGYYGAAKDPKGTRSRGAWRRSSIVAATMTSCSTPGPPGTTPPVPALAATAASSSCRTRGPAAPFANMGDMWRAGYDMPPSSSEQDTDRLWQQVNPLRRLHCYVRAQLQKTYGKDKVPRRQAHPRATCSGTCGRRMSNV